MGEHERMVEILSCDKTILAKALGLDVQRVFVRGKEYQFDPTSDERADLVIQDRFDPYKGDMEATVYVIEVKSDFVDHEVLGQLQKAIDCLYKVGQSIRHWGKVTGVAIAPTYTPSGLQLLKDKGFACLRWREDDDGVTLPPFESIPKRARLNPT